jgi:hypothetical protein
MGHTVVYSPVGRNGAKMVPLEPHNDIEIGNQGHPIFRKIIEHRKADYAQCKNLLALEMRKNGDVSQIENVSSRDLET